MSEPPAGEPLAGLTQGEGELPLALADSGLAQQPGGVEATAGPEPGPNSILIVRDAEQAAVEAGGELAHVPLGSGAIG